MSGIADIRARLPHRHPIQLVDQVTEFVPGERITALKLVTSSEPWFCERLNDDNTTMVFPPGLLIESWCQAAALLAVWDAPRPHVLGGDVPLLGSLSDVTFEAYAEPGSVIRHHARLVRDLGDSLLFEGEAEVDGHTLARIGQMLMVIRSVEVVTARSVAAATTSEKP